MSTEPTPAPADLDAFDEWARQAADTWQRTKILAAVEARWADPALPADQRALAAVWSAPSGNPGPIELAGLIDEPGLDPVLRARLQTAAAAAVVAIDPAAATTAVEQALPVVADPAVHIRTRLSTWLTASEVYVRTNRGTEAMQVLNQAGEAAKADGQTPSWAFVAIDAERLALAASRARDRQQLAASVHRVADAARAMAPSPTVFDVLVKMGGLLSALGAAPRAEEHMDAVLAATEGVAEAQGVRFQALLVLADALFSAEGPEAAMEAQRRAITTIEPLGDTPMLGWAHRGLAVQLRSLERHGESAEEFAVAATVYTAIGMGYDAAALRLEQASSLLHADEPAAARALAEAVAASADDLPEERRPAVQMRVHQVLAEVDTYDGEIEAAAEHWLEVAEVAATVGVSPLEAILTAAQLFAADDDIDEANAQFGRAELAAADEPDPAQATAMVMRIRAEALRDAGHADEAAEMARVAANHARTAGDVAQAVYLSVIAADSLHAAGESQAAAQLYEDTIAEATEAGMPTLRGAVHAGFANLLRDLGRADDAVEQDRLAGQAGASAGGPETLSP